MMVGGARARVGLVMWESGGFEMRRILEFAFTRQVSARVWRSRAALQWPISCAAWRR
jgi:hypothetical protein